MRGVFIILVAGILILGACAMPKPIVFDENLPQEQASCLYIYPGLEVKAYNGIDVPYKINKIMYTGITSTWRYVLLPPGEMEFTADASIHDGRYIYIVKDILFKYTFEAGIDYVLFPDISREPNKDEIGVNIYAQDPRKFLKTENLVGFAPLYDAKGRVVQVNDFYK